MEKKFRFIHAADIHLGSFLNINRVDNEIINDLSKNGVYYVFEQLCEVAIISNCDFILICGDLYDSEYRSVKANNFFINQCNKLKEKNISVYVIYGNHDALNKIELLSLPSNVFVCGSEKVETFEFKKNEVRLARIIGKSYGRKHESKKFHEDYEILDKDLFNIAMLHTALEANNKNYIPCSLGELKNRTDIDYWALGHIHKKNILNYENPAIIYSGIPQGRDGGEEGIGGCFMVEVNEKTIEKIEFISLSKVVYSTIEIIIGNENSPGNITELENLIISTAKNIAYEDVKGYVVKWVVRGFTELHDVLCSMGEEDINSIIGNLNNELLYDEKFIFTDSIVIRTSPKLQEYDILKNEHMLFKELDNIIQLCFEDEKYKEYVLNNFGRIWKGNSFENIEEDKFSVNDDVFQEIIEQAKNLIIEEFVKLL